ncbi:hypothetical protein FRC02_004760 [Tulasnella sp. 418]|nr:hypothetical protein FRC02_004760 [Tulasnella sp. 418]
MGLALIVILLVFARFSEEKNILGRQSSNGLQWGSCDVFSGIADPSLVCANFTVPLDWSNTASDQFAYLFVAKLQARNSPALGTIFMNPGDSSYPGTSYLRWKSELLSDITGGVFDIVSWDPRGIGFTYPRISCGAPLDVDFTDDLLNARSSGPSQADIDGFLANATTIETAFKAFAQQCVDTHQDNLRYIGTVATARDLVALADAIEGPGSLIRYWGLSHGTLLGSYLLDLFPERIGRVVLDGVQDATLYSQSPSYLTYADSIRDADYALQAFFDACAEAGSSRCAIAVPGSTGTSLRQWINDLIDAAYDAVQAQNVGIRVRPSVLRHLLQATAISPESWRTNAETLASMFRDLHYIGTSSTHSVTSTQYSVQPITSSPHTTQYNGYGH